MAGIYYHIPFCKRICSYCDFYRTAQIDRLPRIIEAMCEELHRRSAYLRGEPIRTRYFGGGTPSLCTPQQIKQLIDTSSQLFDCSQVIETTLEANPDDLHEDYLEALLSIGIDRLSIGIQSFDDGCLKLMNRRHTALQAEQAICRAQQVGFKNLTIDLIFGVPGFGGESFERSIDKALALGVQHISAYLLTIEPRTRFGVMAARGELTECDEATCEAEYMLLHERLTAAGYEHYEISNYALPGYRARHNSSYWDGTPYLGIGPAAHSFDGVSRQWNASSVDRYLEGQVPEREELTRENQIDELLMTRLRTAEGLDLRAMQERFGPQLCERILREARPLLEQGRLQLHEGRLWIPAREFLRSDAIISSLFEG